LIDAHNMSEGDQAQKGPVKEHNDGDRPFEVRPKNTTKLQIKNLQTGTTKEDLHDLCRRFGQIVALDLNPKGTLGLVTFSKADEAQLAIHKLDGTSYRGFPLRVSYWKEFVPKKGEGEQTASTTPITNKAATTVNANTSSTATSSTTTTSTPKQPEIKPAEPKPRFAQQQKQIVKPKQPAAFNVPKEQKAEQPPPEAQQPQQTTPQEEEKPTQPQQKEAQQKEQQAQGKQGKKGKNKQGKNGQQQAPTEVRYKLNVEKTIIHSSDPTKPETQNYAVSVSHQQYLDYIIPLLKEIQVQKEKDSEHK